MTTPYMFQLQAVRQLEAWNGRGLLAMEMGLGKAQPHDARVLTPHGWTRMGRLRIGSKLIGSNGRPTTVTGVFPQGEKPVYRVSFSDGTHTECCDDHLWSVFTPGRKWKKKPNLIMSLRDIRKRGVIDSSGNRRFYIPLIKPVEFEETDLPVHPYLIGYLIANGCISFGLGLSTRDPEIVDRLRTMTPEGYRIVRTSKYDYSLRRTKKYRPSNSLIRKLKLLNLHGKRSFEKTIPSIYLYGALEDRIALFQGLMDGDGTVSGNNLSYSTTSKKLAKQVANLVRSFGGTARIHCREHPIYTYRGEVRVGRPCYGIGIAMPNSIKPFWVRRKADRYLPRQKYVPSKAIIKIEEVGIKECQCITVDANDRLYTTDQYILTHNTICSLLFAHRHPDLRPIVVVCDASLKYHWQREATKHFNMAAEVLEGRKAPKGFVPNSAPITVVNYDILKWRLPYLKARKPKIIIIDETSAISNPSQRTRAVRKLCKGVPSVIGLSGTPLMNRPIEVYNIVDILKPDLFQSRMTFAKRYCRLRMRPWGWDMTGACHLPELNRRLQGVMFRRRKADVLKELPQKQRTVIPMDLSDPSEYQDAMTDFVSWIRKRRPSKLNSAERMEGLAKLNYLKQLAGKLKLPNVYRWVDEFLGSGNEKLILFAHHVAIVQQLQERYKHTAVMVNGSVTGRKRQEAIDSFVGSKKTRLFVGNIRAAGKGWSAKGCSHVAFAELDFVPGMHSQCEDRTHGIGRGQKGVPTNCWYLVAKNTIEERLLEIIQNKQRVISSVLDGEVFADDLNVYDLLTDSLLKGKRL